MPRLTAPLAPVATGLCLLLALSCSDSPAPAPQPTKLRFTQQPQSTTAGVALNPAIAVALVDAGDNIITSASRSITIALALGSSATLNGTTTVATVNGVASFTDLSLNAIGTGYVLVASTSDLPSANSSAFTITVGPGKTLEFTQQPVSTTGGVPIASFQVTERDAGGNVATGASEAITIAFGNNPAAGTLSGNKTVSASSGVATFTTVAIDKAGSGYTLIATGTGLSNATSSAFNVTVGPAAKLVFAAQPATSGYGVLMSTAPQVSVQDAGGNAVSSGTVAVTLALGTNPGSATLSGNSASSQAGVATFSNLVVSKPGTGYTLIAQSSGLQNGESSAFNQTSPSTVATLGGVPDFLNVVSEGNNTPTRLIWSEDFGSNPYKSNIKVVNVTGGPVTTIAADVAAVPVGVAGDGTTGLAYWYEVTQAGGIKKASLSGTGGTSTLANGPGFYAQIGYLGWHLDASSGSVFFVGHNAGLTAEAVRKVSALSGAITDLASAPSFDKYVTYLLIDGVVYFADGNGSIASVSASGGAVTPIATSTSAAASGFAVIGSKLYWADQTTHEVLATFAAGGGTAAVQLFSAANVWTLATDGISLYVQTRTGRIDRYSIPELNVTNLAPGLASEFGGFGVHVVGADVYYFTPTSIRKVPK